MLPGLDMLKWHQCSIDLKKNVLMMSTTGSQTIFLPEGELTRVFPVAIWGQVRGQRRLQTKN